MDKIIYTVKDTGIFNFMACLSASLILTVTVMMMLRRLAGVHFRSGWKCAMWAFIPLFLLFPVKMIMPYALFSMDTMDLSVKVFLPEHEVYDSPVEIKNFSAWEFEGGIIWLHDIIIAVWASVAAVLIIWQILRLLSLYRKIRRDGHACVKESYLSILAEECSALDLKIIPSLKIFSMTDTPFAAGIFRPMVILPDESLSDEEIRLIFRHELTHIKRRDVFVKLLYVIFRCINWFNPFAYLLCRMAFEDMELSCDEKVTEKLDENGRVLYSKVILSGASKGRYSAVTTYLSTSGKTLKQRISAVLNIRKLSSLIPCTVAFIAVTIVSGTVYAQDNQHWLTAMFCYPVESNPYYDSGAWRTCTADSYSEAAEKIWGQYLDMFTGEDVPEYYRIEEYDIEEVYDGYSMHKENGIPVIGVKYIGVRYTVELANKCGNSLHDKNFGLTYANGCYTNCIADLELKRNGNEYTAVNIGFSGWGNTNVFHFANKNPEWLRKFDSMAMAGLLDYEWDMMDNYPLADDIVEYEWFYYTKTSYPITDTEVGFLSDTFDSTFKTEYKVMNLIDSVNFKTVMPTLKQHVSTSEYAVKNDGIITYGMITPQDTDYQFCGYDYDTSTGNIVFKLNANGKGIMILAETEENDTIRSPKIRSLSITEPFEVLTYADSFLTADLPAGLTEYATAENARAILEYMKTPRDGSDFTVLDYRNITETPDGIFADVKFKGRLEGIYSSDLTEESYQSNIADHYNLPSAEPQPIISEFKEPVPYDFITVCIIK